MKQPGLFLNEQQRRIHEDQLRSEKSKQWSQFASPGNSHLDEMLKKRMRVNFIYYKEKGERINIPQSNRMPLLPNEQYYSFKQQSSLPSIKPDLHQDTCQKKRVRQLQKQLDQDPITLWIQKQWSRKTPQQLKRLRLKQSILLLSRSIDLQLKDTLYILAKDKFRTQNQLQIQKEMRNILKARYRTK